MRERESDIYVCVCVRACMRACVFVSELGLILFFAIHFR